MLHISSAFCHCDAFETLNRRKNPCCAAEPSDTFCLNAETLSDELSLHQLLQTVEEQGED